MLKFGFQSIIYGGMIEDVVHVLDVVAASGFRGIEFSQSPDHIKVKSNGASRQVKANELRRLLDERGLKLLGLAGGSIKERMRFCDRVPPGESPLRPLYLYTEECDHHQLCSASARGFRLALHPHVFMANHLLEDARMLFDHLDEVKKRSFDKSSMRCKALMWLPDTAHLHIVGEDIYEALQLVSQDRIAAVHLKDWDSAYGRSYHRYAKGFTELGRGDVRINGVLETLNSIGYKGWVVVEQDYSRSLPAMSAYENAAWLQRRSERMHIDLDRLATLVEYERSETAAHLNYAGEELNAGLVRSLFHEVDCEMPLCYDAIARAAVGLSGCDCAAVWSYSPVRDEMSLLGSFSEPPGKRLPGTVEKSTFVGAVLDSQVTKTVRLSESASGSGRTPELPELCNFFESAGLAEMHIIPVPNRCNPHHIRFIVTVFNGRDSIVRNRASRRSVRNLEGFVRDMASVADAALNERCSYGVGRVNALAEKHPRSKEFLAALGTEIKRTVHCQGITIFLVDENTKRLVPRYTTGLRWYEPDKGKYYPENDKYTWTGRVRHRNQPVITRNAITQQKGSPRSYEVSAEVDGNRHGLLLVPLVNNSGKVLGVIRCRNKTSYKEYQAGGLSFPVQTEQFLDSDSDLVFTDDDAAVLDAMGHAASAYIELYTRDLYSTQALAMLHHEILMPVVAVRGAVESMVATLERKLPDAPRFFKYDYPNDMLMWTGLMTKLVDNLDLYARSENQFDLECTLTHLRADIIAPAVRQLDRFIRQSGFDPSRIAYASLADIPSLYIDRARFQQVLFNLLSNAVKFAYPAPELFRITIEGERTSSHFMLIFRDWGPGISKEDQMSIFAEGQRGEEPEDVHIRGRGLGLWVVRRIVEAHGGHVELTNLYSPTEFTITLPLLLEKYPPDFLSTSKR